MREGREGHAIDTDTEIPVPVPARIPSLPPIFPFSQPSRRRPKLALALALALSSQSHQPIAMSDNREEAQQELVDAGIEDALGVSGGFGIAVAHLANVAFRTSV
jgi:hypothetical protein